MCSSTMKRKIKKTIGWSLVVVWSGYWLYEMFTLVYEEIGWHIIWATPLFILVGMALFEMGFVFWLICSDDDEY